MATSAPDLSQFTPAAGGGVNVGGAGGTYTATDATGDQGVLSGLNDIFSTVSAGVTSYVKATNQTAPRAPIATPQGTLIWNPATGQYQSSLGIAAQSSMSPLLLLLAVGLVAFLIFKK